jgi:hypothetical protein
LIFALLKEADRDYLWKLSQQFWKPPPLPEIPVNLNIEFFGFEPRQVASFESEGLWFGLRGQTELYEWGDVGRLLIIRLEHDRQDFRKLELTLPDQTLTCQLRKGYSPNWSGASAEVIARMLQHYVMPDRAEVYALTGSTTSLAEATCRLDYFKRRTSSFWDGRAIVTIMVLITVAGFAVGIFRLPVALFLLGLLSLSLLAFRRTKKILQKEQEKLEAEIAKLTPVDGASASQEVSIV